MERGPNGAEFGECVPYVLDGGGGHLRNGNWRMRSGWHDAIAGCRLVGVTPHDLRRTFGSLARSAGADLRWIQKGDGS